MSDSFETKESTIPSFSSGVVVSQEQLEQVWGEIEALADVDLHLALQKLDEVAAMIGETEDISFWRSWLLKRMSGGGAEDVAQKEWLRGLGRVKVFAEHDPVRALAELDQLSIRFGETPEIRHWRESLTKHKHLVVDSDSNFGIVPTGEYVMSSSEGVFYEPERQTIAPVDTIINVPLLDDEDDESWKAEDLAVVARVLKEWKGERPRRKKGPETREMPRREEVHPPQTPKELPASYKHRNAMIFEKPLTSIVPGTPPGEMRVRQGEIKAVKESDLQDTDVERSKWRFDRFHPSNPLLWGVFVGILLMSQLLSYRQMERIRKKVDQVDKSSRSRIAKQASPMGKRAVAPVPAVIPERTVTLHPPTPVPEKKASKQLLPSKEALRSKTHGFLHILAKKPIRVRIDDQLTNIHAPTYQPIRLTAGSHRISFSSGDREVEKQIYVVAGQLHYFEIYPEDL